MCDGKTDVPTKPVAYGPTLTNCVLVSENPSSFTIDGRKRASPYKPVPKQNIGTKRRRT